MRRDREHAGRDARADRARAAFTWLGRAARVALARQAPVESRALWQRARGIAEELGLEDERLHAMLGMARSAAYIGRPSSGALVAAVSNRSAAGANAGASTRSPRIRRNAFTQPI